MTENRTSHHASHDSTSHDSTMSRRHFLHCSACATAAAGAASFSGIAFAAIQQGREVMKEFPYGAVQLTSGPVKEQFDSIHAHYLALDNDSVLKVFRQAAGLPAPGKDMGGWYDSDGFVPGLTLGQWISGLSRLGAATGDRAAHAKSAALVHGFGQFLSRVQNPYAGKNSEKNWAAYVMDKYVVGLVDAYRLSGNEEAKRLLPMVIDKCLPFISPVSKDRIGKVDPPWDETYVLSENLFHVADITGDDRYRRLAVHYLLDKEWFDPLAAGQDVLPTKHAYSHTIALSSGGQAYLQLGADKYKKALVNAWEYMEPQRFASGGWGPEEQFVELHQGKLAASLENSKAHFETPCGAFADLKLARYLIRLTGGARYGDGLERTLYNTMLATRFPDSDGNYPYYSNYGPKAATKEYYQRKWPCCSGTLLQGVSDYVLGVYFHDDKSLLVNMFVPSKVSWDRPGGAVLVEQETDYPAADTSRLRIVKPGNGRFDLKVRIPHWAKGARLTVNGRAHSAAPGDHAVISRRWSAGDVVEIVVPQPLRTLPIDDRNPNLEAVMRGAIMYVGLNPWEGADKQALPLPSGLRPVSGSAQSYILPTGQRPMVFVPYYRVVQERYNTYFRTA